MVASSSITPSSRSEKRVSSTAVPWGISLSRQSSSFSRKISAQICRSGWSVIMSSGKSWGPSGRNWESSSSSSSTPSPFLAEMGRMAAKSWAAPYTCMTESSFSFSTVSILLITSTAGTFRLLMRWISSASGPPMWSMGSTSRSTASTSATLSRTTFTM